MDRLDKLGEYFVYHNIRERLGITFERFVELVDNGTWSEYVRENYYSDLASSFLQINGGDRTKALLKFRPKVYYK